MTAHELIEAEKEFRKETAEKNEAQAEKLSLDDLDAVAGGDRGDGEDAPDGHEMGCSWSYHGVQWQVEHDVWCSTSYYCKGPYYHCAMGQE